MRLDLCFTLVVGLLLCPQYAFSSSCELSIIALYRATFEAFWSKTRFPKVYPESRPKAEWSSLIGRSHSDGYKMFTKGELVSDALQQFAEYGDTTQLEAEGQGHSQILDSFTSPPLDTGTGVTETQFFIDSSRDLVSFAVKIVPSPDWFVGIDSYALCSGGNWIDSVELDLWPLDAGSQRGYTFSSPRWRSDPQEVITEITSTYPNHTADAFYYPQMPKLPPIARIRIQLVQLYNEKRSEVPVNSVKAVQFLPPKIETKSKMYADQLKGRSGGILKPPLPYFPRHVLADPQPVNLAAATSTDSTTTSSPTPPTLSNRSVTPNYTASTPKITTSSSTYKSFVSVYQTSPSMILNKKIQAILERLRMNKSTYTPSTRLSPSSYISLDNSTASSSTQATGLQSSSKEKTVERLTTPDVPVSAERRESLNAVESNQILPPDYAYDYETKACIVSEWTEWSNCSRTCGYGVKTRTRTVVDWTENIACPELHMEQLCGSMKKCNWNHFSFKFNSTNSLLMPKKPKRMRKKKLMSARPTKPVPPTRESTRTRIRLVTPTPP